MAVTFPLSLPAKNYRSIEIVQRKVVGVSTSPFSLVPQTYEHPGERWEATIALAPMARADAEPWVAWLLSLRGPVGSFLLGDVAGATARGSAGAAPGTPQVDGNQSAQARTLAIKTGLVGPVSNYLRAGDWLQLGSGSTARLHKVLTDASLDISGKATLDIWPSLRAAVSNNATVTLASARGLFMLAGSAGSYEIDSAGIYRGGAIACVEDLRS